MKKSVILCLFTIIFLLSSCTMLEKKALTMTKTSTEFTDTFGENISVYSGEDVIVSSGSFAQIWQLAGGKLLATTDDSFENGWIQPGESASIGALHDPNLEKIFELSPHLVILSADIPGNVKLQEPLSAASIQTAYFSVQTFEDYLSMLKICTAINGREDLYIQNGENIAADIQDIIQKNSGKPAPKVLLIRAGAGKVAVRGSDTMTGIMLQDLGCINIADTNQELLENLSLEAIIDADPDFIFATVFGDETQSMQVLENTLTNHPGWAGLTAVKENRYHLLPTDLFHYKPNNRWAESYAFLSEILYGT